ncbi:MAG: hypothetical protein ACRD7E_21575 [Bryobacteraceae bacterium]
MNIDATGRIESLIQTLESAPESQTRAVAMELAQAILTIHGEGLKQIVTLLESSGETGAELLGAMCGNHLISSLLSLHDLHPESLRSRAERAVTQLHAKGLKIELAGISEADVITITLADSSPVIRKTVEEALLAAVPDVGGLIFEPRAGFVPVAALSGSGSR